MTAQEARNVMPKDALTIPTPTLKDVFVDIEYRAKDGWKYLERSIDYLSPRELAYLVSLGYLIEHTSIMMTISWVK